MTGRVEMTYGYPPIATKGTTVTITIDNDHRPLTPRELERMSWLSDAAAEYLRDIAAEMQEGEQSDAE